MVSSYLITTLLFSAAVQWLILCTSSAMALNIAKLASRAVRVHREAWPASGGGCEVTVLVAYAVQMKIVAAIEFGAKLLL